MGKSEFEKTIEGLIRDRDARIEVVRKSHFMFFHTYFGRYVTFKTADFHKKIFAITEDESIPLAVIVAFRYSGKSTIVATSLPLWSILGRMESKFVLLLAQTQPKAQQMLRNIKHELESNDLLKQDLGPFQEESDQWGMQALVLKKFGAKIAIGSVEQSIRGIRHLEHRPDLIILDDVEDTASVKTKEGRDKVWEWFTNEIIPARGNKCRIFAVGNLLHKDSLLKRIERFIKSESTPGVYVEYPVVDAEGNPMWPGKYPTKESIEAERLGLMDRIAWHREYLLEIVSDDDQIILPEWIHYYDELPPERPRMVYIGVDPAISKKQTADYTAIVSANVYGYGEKTRVYVLGNVVNRRLTFHETCEYIDSISRSVSQGMRATLLVEGNSYQEALVQELKRRGHLVESIKNYSQDKRARLYAASNLFETMRIFFPRKGAESLVNQILGFGIETHDDLMDAGVMIFNQVLNKIGRSGSTVSGKVDLL